MKSRARRLPAIALGTALAASLLGLERTALADMHPAMIARSADTAAGQTNVKVLDEIGRGYEIPSMIQS